MKANGWVGIAVMLTVSGVIAADEPPAILKAIMERKAPEAPAAKKTFPTFPGAEGFGREATGGRGGKVMIVTNLNPDGPGSLQEACAAKGPRIVVFEVSGVVSNMITIENSDITIAGQTAPGAGITIAGQLTAREGISNVVIRHLRVRPMKVADTYAGPEGEKRARRQYECGLNQGVFDIEALRADPGEWHHAGLLNGVRNLMVDHCTFSWGSDEVVSLCRSVMVTVQWCTMEEGAHGEGKKFNGCHGNGLFSGYNRKALTTVHHNLFVHMARRNPTVRDGVSDIRNNVIYNYRQGFSHDGGSGHGVNFVGNVYKIGPNSKKPMPQVIWWGSRVKTILPNSDVVYYMADNRDFHDANLDLVLGKAVTNATPFAMPAVTTQPAMEAYERVLARAGAWPRDAVTRRCVQDVRDETGDWGRREPEGGLMEGLTPGQAPKDTDRDGMPDDWEKKNGLDPAKDDSARTMDNGYTAIEMYLAERAEAVMGAPSGEARGGAPSRADAIRRTLAAIEQQLAAHGGSWEKWSESLKTYREDLKGCYKLKWPWPAEKGYVFQGAAIEIIRRESFYDLPDGERPLESLVHFSRQLKALGIDLIVAIIPSKLSIHPEYIHTAIEGGTRPVRAPKDRMVSVAVTQLMYDLLRNDVEVVNLHEAFREFRLKSGDGVPLFYVGDGHYLNRGAQFSAQKIVERLKRYDFVKQALAGKNPYTAKRGARTDGDKADDTLLLIKDRNGRRYQGTGDSPVFVLGDSHLGYNTSTAPFSGQIAYLIGMPVTEKWKEGLSSHIPVEVARDRNLKKRKVVVLHFSERMMRPRNGHPKWPLVNLPGAEGAKSGAIVRSGEPAPAAAVAAASPPPKVVPAVLGVDYMGDAPGRPDVWVLGGDMVERGFGWAHYLAARKPAWRVWKVARRGWQIQDAVAEFDAVAKECPAPDAVLIGFGESESADTWMKGRKTGDFEGYLGELVKKLRAHDKTKNASIAFVTPFPVRTDWLGHDAAKKAPKVNTAAFAEAVRTMGGDMKIPVADLHEWALDHAGETSVADLRKQGFLADKGCWTAPDGGALCGLYVARSLADDLPFGSGSPEAGSRFARYEKQMGELDRILAETCAGIVRACDYLEPIPTKQVAQIHFGDEARVRIPPEALENRRVLTFVMQGMDEGYIAVCMARTDWPYQPRIDVTYEDGKKKSFTVPGYGYWGAIAEETPDKPVSWDATSLNFGKNRLRPVSGGPAGKRHWTLLTFNVVEIGEKKVANAELYFRYGPINQRVEPAGKGVKVALVEGRDAWVAHGAATWRTRDGIRPWTGGRVDKDKRRAKLDAFLKKDLLPEVRAAASAEREALTSPVARVPRPAPRIMRASGPAATAGAGGAAGKGKLISGTVAEASPPPDRRATYPHYLMKFYLTKLAGPDGKRVGTGDGVVHVLAMHNRKVLPVAKTRSGRTLKVLLTPWSVVEKRYGKLQSGNLPSVDLEIEKAAYWGELPGQPSLTDEELARVGQDDRADAR